MPIQKRHLFIFAKAFLDVTIILLGFQTAYLLQIALGEYDFQRGAAWFRLEISTIYAFIFVTSAQRLELYSNRSSLFNVKEKANLLRAIFITTILFLALNSAFHFIYVHFDLLLTSIILIVLLSCYRHFLFKYYHRRYLEGKHERKVLIYGAGETGKLIFKKMYFMEGGDYSLVGFIDDQIPAGTPLTLQRARSKARHFTAKVLGGLEDLGRIVKGCNIYQVILAMPSATEARTREIIKVCQEIGVKYAFVPHLYKLRLEQIDTKNIGDIPLVQNREIYQSFFFLFFKRLFDLILSSLLLLLLLPFFPILTLLVKLGSKGPVFFQQKRVGRDGKLFTMYKFRTMSVDTPAYMPSPGSNAPSLYISKIGSFLRDTNLDEIPQLWNVLLGSMSIVGPRPEMPFHVEKYNLVQRDRLKVKPGLTGFWQISPDRDKEIHDNIDYDLYYLNHQTFFVDLVLVVETVLLTVVAIWNKVKRLFLKQPLMLPESKELSSSTLPPTSLSAPN